MNSIYLRLICIFLLFCACSRPKDYVLKEKDLIPEGVAFDERTNTIYVSSIYRQKVIGIDPEGKEFTLIPKAEFEYFSPLGMEVDQNRYVLWVCTPASPLINNSEDRLGTSAILSFDLNSRTLIKKYQLPEKPTMINDLTLDSEGNVYGTETLQNKLYKVNRQTDSLELFLELEDYHHPNGIVFYRPRNCLFVATDEGIVKVQLPGGEIQLLETDEGIDTRVIDGLAIYENFFIGHQSTKVSRFYFDPELTKVTKAEVMDSGKEFDSSTTGEIGHGYYYFIVNSQLRSGIDRPANRVKPLDSLEQVIVRRIKP